MKRILLVVLSVLLMASAATAADKTKALLAIENARVAVTKLEQRGATNQLVADDIVRAKGYLQRAETTYKENISWLLLGNLSDAAEPQVRNYAEMSEIAAGIGLSKLEKIAYDTERQQLGKAIGEAQAKVNVFEQRAAEVAKLKSSAGKYDAAAQEIAELKTQVELLRADKLAAEALRQEKADLLKQLNEAKSQVARLTGQLETGKMERATMSGQIEALNTDKSLATLQIKKLNERVVSLEKEQVALNQKKEEALRSEKQLSAVNRTMQFREKLSKIGAITNISADAFTLVIPRSDVVKTTSRGHVLSPDADKNSKELLEILPQYPEYSVSVQVFGYGKPPRLEGQKAADGLALMVRNYLALKLGAKADSIQASGGTAPSPLFSSKAKESNKRIELTFKLRSQKM